MHVKHIAQSPGPRKLSPQPLLDVWCVPGVLIEDFTGATLSNPELTLEFAL